MIRRAPLALVLLLAACAPPPPPVAPPTPTVTPLPPPAPASPSLLALVPPAATAVIRIDWKAARASPLHARLLAELTRLGALDPAKPHCLILPDAVDEVVIALENNKREGAFLALRTHDEGVVRGCMPELAEGSSEPSAPVAGYAATVLRDDDVAVFADGLLLVGSRPDLEAALSPARRVLGLASIVHGLDVSATAVVSVYREGPGYFGAASPVFIVLETDADHLAIRATGTLPSPEEASALLLQATTLRDTMAKNSAAAADDDTRALQPILASARLAAHGARVHGEIEVKGGVNEQSRFALLVVGAALATSLGEPPPRPADPEEPLPRAGSKKKKKP
jgi:hypothetical protein